MNSNESPLAVWRRTQRATQEEMARVCGVSIMTYQLWERGTGFPNSTNIQTLETVVGSDIVQAQKTWREQRRGNLASVK